MLNDGDDIWTYFPRTRRVRKLASHAKKQKVPGSDFSFGDFSSEDTWKEDYISKNTGAVTKGDIICWELSTKAKENADVDYPTVILLIRQDNYYPVQINYLDERGRIEKSLDLTNIVDIDGYPTAPNITRKSFDWYKNRDENCENRSFRFSLCQLSFFNPLWVSNWSPGWFLTWCPDWTNKQRSHQRSSWMVYRLLVT